MTNSDAHITIRRNDLGRFEIHLVGLGDWPRVPDRDYGRLDSAVSTAWNKCRHTGLQLRFDLRP